MSKIRQTTLILGEGITEFFFLNSLKDDYSALRTKGASEIYLT